MYCWTKDLDSYTSELRSGGASPRTPGSHPPTTPDIKGTSQKHQTIRADQSVSVNVKAKDAGPRGQVCPVVTNTKAVGLWTKLESLTDTRSKIRLGWLTFW